MNRVIGISGKPGVGKTTLARALSAELNAEVVYWDDFVPPGTEADRGDAGDAGDAGDEPAACAIADALVALKTRTDVDGVIVFDAPLGRLHRQTGHLIDCCVYLDAPLDVCLCRRLLRDFTGLGDAASILTALDDYLARAHPLPFDEDLKRGADVVVDGMLPIARQLESIRLHPVFA